ncbi:response regulator [Brevibacillus fluminis]|uniref:Circadian input-output histidine kinase CikA n=2 Tax=Brevibacillus fluminis TaxID=511487 RepID=A0A3M8DBP3_9BACL|nr:response regulator [Brevibacillus fluminis]
MRMKIKTKLYLGFGSILIMLVLGLGIIQNILIDMKNVMSHVVIDRYEKVKMVTALGNEIQSMSNHLNNLYIAPKNKRDIEVEDFESASINAATILATLEKRIVLEELKQLLYKNTILFESYNRVAEEAIQAINSDNTFLATQLQTMQVIPKRTILMQGIKDFQDGLEDSMDETIDGNIKAFSSTIELLTALVVVTALVGTIITIWILRSITSSMNKVTSVITKGNYGVQGSFPRIEVTSNDEIGKIASAFNQIAASMEDHAKQEKEYKEVLQEQNWLKTKIAEFSSMYQGVHDLQALAHLFITKITPLVGAGFGVFYLKKGSGEEQRFVRLATYAAMEFKADRQEFRLGEGLVGQSALEKRMIQINQLPSDYIQITSGLGKGLPNFLMVVPVLFEGEVMAVVELATFQSFDSLHLKLLDQVLGNLGITINSVDVYMKIEKLLNDSQRLTEQLQTRSEELQGQKEELKSTNEQLALQFEHSEQKSRELEKVKFALEEKAQQVLISSQYKSEFLANMSHELRTPLNSMLILAHILSENKENNLSPSQVEYANTIYSSGNDLLRLINEVLDLSKVESGKMELFSSEVFLADVQTFLERQFVPVANQKGIGFAITLDEKLADTIYTDEQRLQQILRNLLSNAFKFTEKGSVHMAFYQIGEELEKPMLAIEVRDTGIGIAKEKQALIFEAFRQADGTTSRKYGGTGLGLSISREIAHLLGGYLHVESEEGVGSTFTLVLPLVTDKLASSTPLVAHAEVASSYLPIAPEPLGTRLPMLENKQVLIVDDDVRNVFALATALEGCQMKVLFAENGREGIERLRQSPDVDLVLMDIMMPEMDGVQAIRAIRSEAAYRDLPIIALTAKASEDDRAMCLTAGASAFISKPVKVNELLALIAEWLPT